MKILTMLSNIIYLPLNILKIISISKKDINCQLEKECINFKNIFENSSRYYQSELESYEVYKEIRKSNSPISFTIVKERTTASTMHLNILSESLELSSNGIYKMVKKLKDSYMKDEFLSITDRLIETNEKIESLSLKINQLIDMNNSLIKE